MNAYWSFFFVLVAMAASAQNRPQPNYTRDWKRADSLVAKGLPKSALDIANRIYKEAKVQKNYPQVARAAMARQVFRSYSDEDSYVELVRSLQIDIQDTPEPAKSVLQSVLADIYWQYFQQNRYKFYNRATIGRANPSRATIGKVATGKPSSGSTAPSVVPNDSTATDFTTWDAPHLIEVITAAYRTSVQDKALLQKTPITDYDVLIDKGDADARPLRPTLYDLLAHRAIGFFQNTEPDLLKPVFKFELNQPSYLAGPSEFTKLTIQSQDSLSGRYQALLLYQQLLAFHLSDANPDALVDVDALRLAFVHRHSVLPDKDALFQQTLEKQITMYKGKSAEAIYAYQLAEFLTNQGGIVRPLDDTDDPDPAKPNPFRWNRKRAADLCRDLIKRFPNTLARKQADALLTQLLAASYSTQVEQVNTPEKPFRALVNYQNTPKITYRIIRLPLADVRQPYNQVENTDEQRRRRIGRWLKRPSVIETSVVLPDDGDLNSHSVEIPIAGLPVGQYVLLLTSENSFSETSENLQLSLFTVSALSYLVRQDNRSDKTQTLFVMNRLTGEPIPNASVTLVDVENFRLTNTKKSFMTDAAGLLALPDSETPTAQRFGYLIASGRDTLLSGTLYNYRNPPQQEREETYARLFTDRAIYRPGQPIYVKGLLYNGKMNQYAVLAGEEVDVEFLDQNGERIAEKTLKTNEFGTFEASFTAPVGRLTGNMTIRTSDGSTGIRVEEYKRPTFEVKVDPIKESFKLEQTVTLSASAKTFSGAVVDGAEVRYRVVRSLQPRWEWWYGYRTGGRPVSQAEIASGTAQTDAQGNVRITFPATPDREQSRESNPVFDFNVTIDVTDRAGETRSATKTLRIGYSAIQVSLAIPPQIESNAPATFPVNITNQSGEKVAAKGQLTVYRLQPPARPLRNRLWSRPDRQFLSRDEFERLFPNDLYANENDPRYWPKGDVVQQQSITSPADSLVKADLSRYTLGEYVAEVTVTDANGETVKERAFFAIVNDKQPTASARPENWVQVRKATAEPGEEAVFWVGNGQPSWILMSVEENQTIVRNEWLKTDGRPRRIAIPVTEKQRGGFAVHFAMVQNGRLSEKSQTIAVPFTNKELHIETQTFRSKLKPGEREQWTLKISGLGKSPAEFVATLYDASLDVFDRLDWPTSFYQPYSLAFGNWESQAFGVQGSQVIAYRYRPQPPVPVRQYDQLGWLGYRFSVYGSHPFGLSPLQITNDAIRVNVSRTEKTITGTAKFKDGSAVAGLSVLVEGTTFGASTDAKGRFSINTIPVSKDVTLIFSFIGYKTQEVVFTQKSKSFQLLPDAMALSEVVVTGYGTLRRKDVTGAVAMVAPMPDGIVELKEAVAAESITAYGKDASKPTPQPVINPRKNFNETAFFIPQMQTDKEGRVVLKFTMPEALTRWRLLAFAHTKDLKTGTLEREIITQKELMITANAPRFFREGDTIRVTARINNLSDKTLPVTATLALLDALTGEPIHQKLKLSNPQTSVSVAAGKGQAVGWTLVIPAGLETVTCRLTAQSGSFTDGEEFTVPVLPNRMLVTDTKPFWVNGKETKTFTLKPLTNLNPELPVQHERLTIEVTSNPSWYALQSLPYLMEYRYECAEQLFSRLYANSLAAHIVGSKPAFKQVIAEWQKNPPRSPLQSNEELKAVTLENSPWLAEAHSEAERQAKLGQLLDANRMASEQIQTLEKLKQLQTAGGGFRWFGGMEPNLSITLHILSGLGHLKKLGVQFPTELQADLTDMQTRAIQYADAEMKQWFVEQKKIDAQQKGKVVGGWYFSATQYLYARSFYLDKPVDSGVLAYLKQHMASNWLAQSLQGQALSAMALNRFGDTKTAAGILQSLLERSKMSEEMGLYWPDNVSGLSWYQTPIETQAYLIEMVDEVGYSPQGLACFEWMGQQSKRTLGPAIIVDEMKRWLLRQKQTQSWSSTKATTEAIYALLLRGSDWLGTGVNTQVSLGGKSIQSRVSKADVITGYEKVTYAATEIKPEMGAIQITKTSDGPAWGALYWQHFEPLDQVMPGSAGLSVQKTLYVQRDSPSGPVISTVASQSALKPGDLVKVRLILKTDRAMEYVHLKDGRASGFEPVAALSGYKYQNGLGYYESPRDASTDFFMSYLPVGTHVFEYDLRVAQSGDFSAGVATVQCFYAPEFSAHSAGERVKVK
ncbi:alpha-2-macroglobulin family protein [Spirosoma fluviale]|uniref:CarboxypepD_reg-like domain-containing protein n=1 Tax=Spirosoma fluviale TaxID=1597977 RepID=A0A286GND2_9BACT|nr:alpha-2-macroglobulin family protein [Spirosoma fluviale]SOD96589.1 CarboxypepD_reg-like domain-containing protein [Spirosoma fluviale]